MLIAIAIAASVRGGVCTCGAAVRCSSPTTSTVAGAEPDARPTCTGEGIEPLTAIAAPGSSARAASLAHGAADGAGGDQLEPASAMATVGPAAWARRSLSELANVVGMAFLLDKGCDDVADMLRQRGPGPDDFCQGNRAL